MNSDASICKQMPKIFVIVVFGAFICYNYISITFSFLKNDWPKLNNTKFVSVCFDTFNTRRTGNMLFVLAGLLYASKLTNRVPIMPESFPYTWINHVFVYDLPRFPNKFIYDPNNSVIIKESRTGILFDEQFRNILLNKSLEGVETILICGYFQSYKYVVEVEKELRNYLKFKNDTLKSVDEFMKNETVGTPDIFYIGVHIRRTDYNSAVSLKEGLTVADENYLNISLNYVIESMGPSRSFIAFMCSDDINWVNKSVNNLNINVIYPNLKVVYSIGHDAAFDLCLLSKCNASIISTGTFSWWSAWLANPKIGLYYSLYPKRNTTLGYQFNYLDYYPSTWKGFPDLET